jgi:hypothetical protein
MAACGDLSQFALKQGRVKKRNNAIAALICGVVPAAILAVLTPASARHWLIGFVIGVVWANGFEYIYHRWLLHRPRSSFGKGHILHHSTLGQAEEPEHVTLGSSPLNVALLFVGNGILLVAMEALLRTGISAGVLLGWATYMIATEEIHWRIHLGGWLPPFLRWSRLYHFSHHDYPNARYNVFFPLFDLLGGNYRLQSPVRSSSSSPAAPVHQILPH